MKKPTRTLDVIAAAHAKGVETVVAGEVAEIHFPKGGGLSLLASKLFVQLLDAAGARVCEQGRHQTTMESLNWSHRDLAAIEETVRELQRTIVSLTVNTPRGRLRKSGQILTDVDREEDNPVGELIWEFSNTFRAVIRNSRHWAAISARAVLAMECKYSPWLYQIAALHAGRERAYQDWTLDDLRGRLGASAPSLRNWQPFKQFVLEPAIAEINHLTGIGVAWEPIKYARRVVAVRLFSWRKSKEELDAAVTELNRHRAGRKERRTSLAGQIAEERASLRRKLAAELQALPAFSQNVQNASVN